MLKSSLFARALAACALLLVGASADATNVLVNPTFNTDTSGWTIPEPTKVTMTFSSNDANGSLTSGSVSVSNSSPNGSDGQGIQQCLNAPTVSSSLTYGGKIFYPSGQARTGPVRIALRWMDGANCTGNQLGGGQPSDLSLNAPNDAWASFSGGPVTVPAGALSARFAPYTSKVEAGGALVGLFDDLFLNNGGSIAPTIGKSFGAASVLLNGSTSLTITITNQNPSALSGLAVTDNLPAGLVVATPNALTNTCGGTATAVVGSGSVSLAAGTLAANASCAVGVNVTATSAGTKVNTTGAVSSTESGAGATATVNLDVITSFASPIPTLGEWALLALSALLALLALIGLRRKVS